MSARRDARESGCAVRPPCVPADREPRRRDAAVRQKRSAAGSARPASSSRRDGASPVSTVWFEPDSSLARAALSGKQLSSLAPTRLAADSRSELAKLVLTETIVSPSQTRSPSTEALARSRIRSTSSSERRLIADIEHDACQRQPDDGEARDRHRRPQAIRPAAPIAKSRWWDRE